MEELRPLGSKGTSQEEIKANEGKIREEGRTTLRKEERARIDQDRSSKIEYLGEIQSYKGFAVDNRTGGPCCQLPVSRKESDPRLDHDTGTLERKRPSSLLKESICGPSKQKYPKLRPVKKWKR